MKICFYFKERSDIINKRHQRKWTPQEVARLKRLNKKGLTDKEIAEELKRTSKAVESKRLSLDLYKPEPQWTEEKIKRLKALVAMGETDTEIAEYYDVLIDKKEVEKKRQELNLPKNK